MVTCSQPSLDHGKWYPIHRLNLNYTVLRYQEIFFYSLIGNKKKKIQQKLRPPGFASYLQEVGKDCCMLAIITKRTNEDMVRVRDGSTKYMSTMRFLQSNFGQGNPGMITGDTHGLHPPP